MKDTIKVAAICFVAGLCLAPQAQAQCPASINPLQTLVGAWGFKQEGVSFYGEGAAGRFTASLGLDNSNNTIGKLTAITTYNFFGIISRLEVDAGRYQIFPDCSGGTLTLNFSTHALSYDFWFVNNGTELYMISSDHSKSVIVGVAKRV